MGGCHPHRSGATAANEEPDGPAVERLVELARSGKIAIARTSGFEADQREASPDQRRATWTI